MGERWIIWGTGQVGQALYSFLEKNKMIENVIAVVDKNQKKWGMIWNVYTVQNPNIIEREEFDKVIIAVGAWRGIYKYLQNEYGVPYEKIDNYKFIHRKALLNFYDEQNNNSEKLRKQLKYIKEHPLDFFNDDFPDKYIDMEIKVFHDTMRDMLYVFYCGKKMYFPREYTEEQVIQYYRQILVEQDLLSPHRYQSADFSVAEDEVVLDIGAAEGNFSLEIIDKVKKLYLVEPDAGWIEALRCTFAPYIDKVCIVQKYITDRNDEKCITIDELAKKELFTSIKMDIEGAEIAALKGGKKTLYDNNIKLFVCTYHKEDAFDEIASWLKCCGYHVSATEGYMVFLTFENLEKNLLPKLVKGVIQAEK
ncbi:FkbM family methyltransferase [Acetatifactor aquisgranensis]|uniref:FkbM family methyltransferase n=1 Tax=Acetatifactor aquisgranensis TaxID=2941233 RepID=UPI00203D1D2E|nr:FkbM family methyltransferase [Acetatifactor aquisgranensis]